MKENILKTQIIEWAKNNLGNSFVFRENQLKVIYQIYGIAGFSNKILLRF